MNYIKKIIETESVEDALMYLSLKKSYQTIDLLYVQYRFEVIAEGILLSTYMKLLQGDKLVQNENGKTIKGSNWVAPDFVKTGKYDAIDE
ncbi:immunity protein [Xenorhabdus mauleonii]|uniref:Immunity protein n=1 Tax=Xenorhabdus mauleonii TaxID=351675 RepID=A0A1I3VV84_9GAMM|nr:hypothetical protein [Xenorhabdus mauleonii]PHM36940.1 immunity protein [Xenorhabdus mauleonii]SFJ99304.1 hypothetical protein SAMN05421680_1234 [Xenorhabdus mauleonii]